jgi:hypothetical protein
MDIKMKRLIISNLRRVSRFDKRRTLVMQKYRIRRGHYYCAACNKVKNTREVILDHIQPIVPVTGWDNWDNYIERLFCDECGYQLLCEECHREKTNSENAARKAYKKGLLA